MCDSSTKTQAHILLLCLMLLGCSPDKLENRRIAVRDIAFCGPTAPSVNFSFANNPIYESPKPIDHPRYLAAGENGGLPTILPNDNRRSAGDLRADGLDINLEVTWGAFFPEGDNYPGLILPAIGELNGPATVPAPLVRVEEGTLIKATVKNSMQDSTITVYGLQTRPSEIQESLLIQPGETKSVTFLAGEVGTYLYWMKLGTGKYIGFGAEEQQLAGAFIVDPKGEKPNDRIMIMNAFTDEIDVDQHAYGFLEALTINGKSWPHTDNIELSVGEAQNWRIINASNRHHPMHLHGFYYDVLSIGSMLKDEQYKETEVRKVVTETMMPFSTMRLAWVPTRPGKWLFHCHLSFHVSHEQRLPGAHEADSGTKEEHMAGLVMGITVKAGPSDLISKGEPRDITLYAKEYDPIAGHPYGMSEDPDYQADSIKAPLTGQPLILRQYQTTNVTVVNRLPEPTSIHWHGLELDAWSDGVPGYSSSEGKTSPSIQPGESFTYKLSLMHEGTFMYHSHLNDIGQLSKGLFGPMIVLGEGEEYNPEVDHFYAFGWPRPNFRPGDMEINGSHQLPIQLAHVGEEHRIRFINIATVGAAKVYMQDNDNPVKLMYLAKDGAELPKTLQKEIDISPLYGNGETADFIFKPMSSGTYKLFFDVGFDQVVQVWEVK